MRSTNNTLVKRCGAGNEVSGCVFTASRSQLEVYLNAREGVMNVMEINAAHKPSNYLHFCTANINHRAGKRFLDKVSLKEMPKENGMKTMVTEERTTDTFFAILIIKKFSLSQQVK